MPRQPSKEPQVRSAFKVLDTDGNGVLQFTEFLVLLQRGDPNFSVEEAEMLFNVADKDLNGQVDFEEFMDFIFGHKTYEDLLPAPAPALDVSEEQAKARVMKKRVTVRSATSNAVKAAGGDWTKLSWRERLEAVNAQECNTGDAFKLVQLKSTPAKFFHGGAVEASQPRRAATCANSDEASSRFPGDEHALPNHAKTTNVPPKANSSASTKTPASRKINSIEEMSQSQLVDYAIMNDDLTFAGRDEVVLAQLREVKENLKTASDPYDILEVKKYIAKGTAGWVFMAADKASGETVALKIVRLTQARTSLKEWYVSKLLREAEVPNCGLTGATVRVLNRDEAPTVIEEQLRNAGPVRYYVCLLQEFMNGGTLEGLAQKGLMSTETMFRALEDVAKTLAKMHAINVQHRDIKPENVLLVTQGDEVVAAKLCDFGSAEIGQSAQGRADDVRRFGVTIFSLATGEGWTKQRLIHAKHDDLVQRLTESVHNASDAALKRLPNVLRQILSGDLEMDQVADLISDLRTRISRDRS
mmetsp:Transcript_111149/g.313620  ORF Transcript_111149/g.313620 Transcript_111149/m.313620 type:complete len:528 (-) Transcript_111149:60-1643(-)